MEGKGDTEGKISTKRKIYSAATTRETALLLVICGFLIGTAHGQQGQQKRQEHACQ